MKSFIMWTMVFLMLVFAMTINTSAMDASVNFFDTSKWENPFFWIQLVGNTIFLVSLYAAILTNRLDTLLDSDEINELYTEVMTKKDELVAGGRKTDLDVYLKMVVSLDERIDLYKKKLESIKRVLGKNYLRVFFGATKKTYRNKQKEIELQLKQATRYQLALKTDIQQLRGIDFEPESMDVKHKEISFDTLFDMVDYEKNDPISVGYSTKKASRKHIIKSPLSAIATVFLALVAFSGTLYWATDIRSVVLIILTLTVAALMKSKNAIQDATGIYKNKKRSLHKTKDVIQTFAAITPEQIKILQDIFIGKEQLRLNPPKAEETPKNSMKTPDDNEATLTVKDLLTLSQQRSARIA